MAAVIDLETDPELIRIEAEKSRRRLKYFVQYAWRYVLNESRPLVWGEYLDVICRHGEAIVNREILRLILTLPPNTLKSTIISVCLPAWRWIERPDERFLFAANDGQLASRDAMQMRELILSKWYQTRFQPKWGMRSDQNEKTWFTNTAGGHRISYSIGDKVTGKKGDLLFVDDPNDAKKMTSPAYRHGVHFWFDHAFSNRMADEKNSPIVVFGQRLGRTDLIGHLKESPEWEECRLSEEFDPENVSSTRVWKDSRTIPGEWLRPERFGPTEKQRVIGRMGSRGYLTQHIQNPQDAEGSLFKAAWLILTEAFPTSCVFCRYWDKAHTEDGGCYTAGVLIARDDHGIWWIIDVVREQHSAMLREQLIRNTAMMDRQTYGHVTIVVEQEPSGGKQSAEETIRTLAGYQVYADPATRDKVARALGFAAQCEAGNVRVLNRPWTKAYLEELTAFPDSQFADQVDATSGGFNWISAKHPYTPFDYEPEDFTDTPGPLESIHRDAFH